MRMDISAPKLFDLHDKVVAITGAMGKLGFQYVHALMDHGAKVALLDKAIFHNSTDSHDMQSLMYIGCDVTDKESLHEALREIKANWGMGPNGLINNAALDAPPTDTNVYGVFSDAYWNKVMDVNVKGVFNCCEVFGGEMASSGGGSIINIASVYGMVAPDQRIYSSGFVKPIAYSVSKSALYNMTRWLAAFWAHQGVRVNTMTLGGVFNNQDEDFVAKYSARVPMGRLAKEDEYNGAAVFLISDASSYMTGANLVIDGGLTAW